MADLRDLTFDTADAVHALLRDSELRRSWDGESVLPSFSVRGLAGHLAAQVFHIERVLAEPDGDGPVLPVVEHYAQAPWIGADLDNPVNVSVREGSEKIAADGQDALAETSPRPSRGCVPPCPPNPRTGSCGSRGRAAGCCSTTSCLPGC